MANRVIHMANGLVGSVEVVTNRLKPSELHW
jgi:hypothetical protein